jgi:hypothetical protein
MYTCTLVKYDNRKMFKYPKQPYLYNDKIACNSYVHIGASMKLLPIEVRMCIAEYSDYVWFLLWLVDPLVSYYTTKKRHRYVDLFTYTKLMRKKVGFFLFDKLHRENDQPAIEKETGDKEWYKNGKLHRGNDKSAADANGNKYWYINGELHRDNDKPALEYANGNKYWYKNGELHRDNDLPAREYVDGEKWWYKEGKLHRDNDLPAIEFGNGEKRWFQNGKLHRDNDLPAIERVDGTKEWYIHGDNYVLHHDNDKPAIEYVNGEKML